MTLRNIHVTLLTAIAFLCLQAAVAFGQPAQRSPIIAAPSIVPVLSGGETSIPIGLSLGSESARELMVLIRGLPSTMALSVGRLFDSGVWGVRPADLPRLRITVAADAGGQTPISLSLVSFAGAELAERHVMLVFTRPGSPVAGAENPPAQPGPARSPRIPSEPSQTAAFANAEQLRERRGFSADEIEQMLLLMRRGSENMAKGRVNIAQMFYRRAAESGWAPGALALAKSYDPGRLPEAVIIVGGAPADPKLAEFWYGRARDLGSPEAAALLQRAGKR